ncbi:similar to Saccharomyces cerevisiae YJR025C BNA1 3-hydroxyanthranilic acid dioxygenase, required for the de novo biosynthesis of NAD from tryptophan via kynurenine [Maudiozyma saulgeensis]|uniref:3-hydroxyanthranilate 3,4-dioxygenase n=1 Tax=Maudiozyma saulgeensis TaxID=1789683 RepID=A0A1X7R5B6_9SACH|nr:similar to Saccharomyces cerevisiae YJR025C BNA1 3-hydroxyanthranilic acid dioxygenase, required for the de novo biosynthesis of NAD from tryptophan via kynurenine [Kazachstania saulgeensis]
MVNTTPINIDRWLEENPELLAPPVSNYCLHMDGFTVMLIGGPNDRTDFHINPTPEWFYQKKGTMHLRIRDPDDDQFKTVIINENDSYLLPANVPHAPIRFKDTIGIVVELENRGENREDSMLWYCKNCNEILYKKSFIMKDLGSQVKEQIDLFKSNATLRTCGKCGTIN